MLGSAIVFALIALAGCQEVKLSEQFVPGSGKVLCIFPKPLTNCTLDVWASTGTKLHNKVELDFSEGPLSQNVSLSDHGLLSAGYAGEGLGQGHCGVTLGLNTSGLMFIFQCSGQYEDGSWDRQLFTTRAPPTSSCQNAKYQLLSQREEIRKLKAELSAAEITIARKSALLSAAEAIAHKLHATQLKINTNSSEEFTIKSLQVAGLVSEARTELSAARAAAAISAKSCRSIESLVPQLKADLLAAQGANTRADAACKSADNLESQLKSDLDVIIAAPPRSDVVCETGSRQQNSFLVKIQEDTSNAEVARKNVESFIRQVTTDLATTQAAISIAEITLKNMKSLEIQQTEDLITFEVALFNATFNHERAERIVSLVRKSLTIFQSNVAGVDTICKSTEGLIIAHKAVLGRIQNASAGADAACKSAQNIVYRLKTNLAKARELMPQFEIVCQRAKRVVNLTTRFQATLQNVTSAAETARKSAESVATQLEAYFSRTHAEKAGAKTDEAKTDEAKTAEAKTDEAKTDEVKTDEARTDEIKTAGAKTDEAKTDEAKTVRESSESIVTQATVDLITEVAGAALN